jgi:hypothetical protein
MNSKLCLPLIAIALGLPVTSAAAQDPARKGLGFFSGVTLERGEPHSGVGLELGGALAVGLTSRLGIQFDATYHTFPRSGGVTYYNPPCLPPGCGTIATSRPSLTIATTSVGVRYAEQRSAGAAFYWVAGLGFYDVLQSPTDGSYTRAGWNVGGGFRLGRSLFLDVRYHQLIQPRTTRSLVPVSFGVRF